MRRLALVFAIATAACGGDSGDGGPSDNFDRRALLSNLGQNVILPTYENLGSAAGAQVSSVSAYCAALGTAGEDTAREDARQAWRAAMDQVQLAELMKIGPAAMNDGALRDELYSWPVSSTCGVDQEVKDHFDDPTGYDISGRLTNRRGMDALEYVLFSEDLNHTCAPQVAPEGWDALADSDRASARCGYAEAAAADVAATAQALVDAWSPGGGDFVGEFSTAGQSGSSFDSAQAALNVTSDAMFFVDFATKDIKLGESAGITVNSCNVVQEPCLEELESQFALHSKQSVAANLRGFQMLFTGEGPSTGQLGFDDMLIELGAPQLAQTMTADIEAALVAAEAIPGTMRDALGTDYAVVVSAHASVKVVTDNLKSQFLTVLGLDIPVNSAGDND